MCLAVPGEVVELVDKEGLRFARDAAELHAREVCVEYQPDALPGDYVLVHVGFAIAKIDAEEAARAWEVLREIGQLDETEGA